jgi:hypothetical protein
MAECVAERKRSGCKPHPEPIWHLAGPRIDSWWRRIKCSETLGITRGPVEDREPTCPDCLAILAAEVEETDG